MIKKLSYNPRLIRVAAALVVAFVVLFIKIYFDYLEPKPIPQASPTPTATNTLSLSTPDDYTPKRATLEGTVVCLPHKNTDGPQTLECAIGIKTEDNKYYALDTNLMSQTPPSYNTGDHIKAAGVITPIENLSSDHWQKYNVQGIFSVTNSLE